MNPKVVVCVGWRPGNSQREANWEVVKAVYEALGLPVVVADSDPDKPLNLPQALNRAVAAAPAGWDAVIVNDADTVLSDEALVEAVQVASVTGCLVHPVTRYWRQREDGSYPDEPGLYHAGGVHVWGAKAWQELGGYDERFLGWAPHDASALWAASALGLFRETDGDAFHMWHAYEPAWVADVASWPDWVDVLGESAPAGYALDGVRPMHPLAMRYHAALDDPAAMRALLDERGQQR